MITINAQIKLDVNDLTKEFWEADNETKAGFFNENKLKEDNWHNGEALVQIRSFVDLLNDDGRAFVEQIYEYMHE